MTALTRRQFVVRGIAAGIAARALRGQAQTQTVQPVQIPGLGLGEVTTTLALRNVTVIDGTGRPAMPGMTVLIAGNKIQSISKAKPHSGVPTVDATGKFLIPGLWDMHVHDNRGDIDPRYIPNGILGVRTMGGSRFVARQFLKRRAEIAEGKVLGPRMVVASQTLYGTVVHNPEEGRAAVQGTVQDGADFIKVYDGVSAETYYAIVDEAKKLKIPFVGHVVDPPGLEACANAGQKSIEHSYFIRSYFKKLTGVATTEASVKSLPDSQMATLCDIFLRNQTWLCPTLTTAYGLTADPMLGQDPRLKYFDDRTRAGWEMWGLNRQPGFDGYKTNLVLVGAMHKAGVGMLAGTDTAMVPSSTANAPYCLPGFGLHDELRHFVAAGLSPMDALRTATYNPAKFFGLRDSLGTVEAGKLAELVLLDADPLADITNTTKINMVITGARLYRRAALDAMLNAVETNAKIPLNPPEVTVDPKLFDGYVGKYQMNPDFILTVTREGDRLFLQPTNQPKFQIVPSGDKDFFFKAMDVQITFVTDDQGNVTSLILHQNGDHPAPRVK